MDANVSFRLKADTAAPAPALPARVFVRFELNETGLTMQFKDVAMSLLLLIGIPLPGWSQTAEELRAWEDTRARQLERLPMAVRSYAASIGCAVTFRPKDVVRWEGAPTEVKYLVLITLDEGCAGGSGTWKSALIAMREGEGGKLFVHPKYSVPELTSMQFPQLIDAIYSTRHGVRFVGRIPQGNDPSNRPTKRVSGTVIWSGEGWGILDSECAAEQC